MINCEAARVVKDMKQLKVRFTRDFVNRMEEQRFYRLYRLNVVKIIRKKESCRKVKLSAATVRELMNMVGVLRRKGVLTKKRESRKEPV